MRVLIADDHDLLRDTLISYLTQEDDITALSTSDLTGAVNCIEADGPFDLVLLDYSMPGMNGLEGLKRMMALTSKPRVALMSGIASRQVAEEALALGAAGFLPKTLQAKSLLHAVRFMAMGEKYAPVEFMTAESDTPDESPLSKILSQRELQMLEGLCAGKSNKEIARDLGLAEPTIKLHLKTLYRKLDMSNRTQAAIFAKEVGLF